MLSALGTALSGLQAQSVKMNSTANNVANSETEGYTPTGVNLSERVQGGVSAQRQRAVTLPSTTQDAESKASQVNLAKEMVDMIATKRMYQANMKTIDSSEKTVGKLLDALG